MPDPAYVGPDGGLVGDSWVGGDSDPLDPDVSATLQVRRASDETLLVRRSSSGVSTVARSGSETWSVQRSASATLLR